MNQNIYGCVLLFGSAALQAASTYTICCLRGSTPYPDFRASKKPCYAKLSPTNKKIPPFEVHKPKITIVGSAVVKTA